MGDSQVTSEAAGSKRPRANQRRAAGRARHAEGSVSEDRRPVGLIRLVVVRVLIAQDVERPAGRHFEDRGHREIRKKPVQAITGVPTFRRREYCAEHKSMTLIEK